MNYIDAIILGVLALFTVFGLLNGLIKQAGSLLGFFVGVWAATHYYTLAMPFIQPLFTQWPLIADPLARVVSFFVMMYLSSFLFRFLVALVDKIFNVVAIIPLLKTANRLGGAGLGLLEGLLIVSASLFIIFHVPLTAELTKSLNESTMAPAMEKISIVLTPLLPKMDSFLPQQLKNLEAPSSDQMDTLKILQEHVK